MYDERSDINVQTGIWYEDREKDTRKCVAAEEAHAVNDSKAMVADLRLYRTCTRHRLV